MDGLEVKLGYLGKLPRSMNDGLCFILVLRGRIDVECNSATTVLDKNDIFVLNHKDIYGITGRQANVVLMVSLSREYVERYPEVARCRYQCCSADTGADYEPHYAGLKKNVARVASLYYKGGSGNELLIQAALLTAMYSLLSDFRDESGEEDNGAAGGDDRLQGMLAYIHQNYRNRITLEEIAAREYMSVQYVSKLFRQKMGVTFLDYLAGLRLDSALSDLLYTRDSVTKIAMQNGFANAKAFNNQFRRAYGVSPSEYRRDHQADAEEAGGADVNMLKVDSEDSLEALVKFLNSYDQNVRESAQLDYVVDVQRAEGRPIHRTTGIVNIGDIRLTQRADTRAQLAEVKKYLRVDYVYFSGFLQMGALDGSMSAIIRRYDFYEVFDQLNGLGLYPMIRIDLCDLRGPLYDGIDAALAWLTALLASMGQRYSPRYLDRWHIELVGTPEEMRRDFARVAGAVKAVTPELRVGMRVEVEREADTRFLLGQTDIAAHIGFLSFALDPNLEPAPTDAVAFESFHRNYHRSHTKKLRELTREADLGALPLYLMDWNTLTGRTVVEAGEFHRTALLADVVAKLSEELDGMAIRMSLFVDDNPESSELVTHAISLFVYRNIRRPMFFVHRAFSELKKTVIYQTENMLVSTDGMDKYALIAYNPSFINPLHSVDSLQRGTGSKTMQISLEGLKPGKYRVKSFLLDKNNGSLYQSWVKIDLSVPLDEEDMDEYMQHASNPAVTLFETEIEGRYTISQEMSLNAMALIILKRYG